MRNATERPRARNTNPVRGEHSGDGDDHANLSALEISRNPLGINDITDAECCYLTSVGLLALETYWETIRFRFLLGLCLIREKMRVVREKLTAVRPGRYSPKT